MIGRGAGLDQVPEQDLLVAARRTREPYASAMSIVLKHVCVEQDHGLFPTRRPQRTAIAQQRSRQSVGTVMSLHGSLAQAANLPAADRRLRVALELEDAPFAHASHDAAGGCALRAGRRIENADARPDEIIRLHIRLDEFGSRFDRGMAAAGERDRRAAEPDGLQEIPAADAITAHRNPLLVACISKPTCGIASSHWALCWSRR